MSMPTSDNAFVEELVADVDAYLHRLTLLTDFAESQVEERIRLARLVNRLASDRDGLQVTISQLEQHVDALDARLRLADRSVAARLTRAPRGIWRRLRRPRA
jgi:hypothetical protein